MRLTPYTRFRKRHLGTVVANIVTGQTARTGGRGGPVYWQSGPFTGTRMYESFESMSDVVTPGFAQGAANRILINNPMTKVTHQETLGDTGFVCSFTEPNGDYHEWYRTNVMASYLGPQPPMGARRINVENLQKLCRTAALAGVQASDVMSLVSLAELRKTLDMLRSPLKTLWEWSQDYEKRIQQGLRSKFRDAYWTGRKTRSINGHRRRKSDGSVRVEPTWSKATSVGDFLSQSTLGINLGWKPTLMEIDTILHKIPQKVPTDWLSSRETRKQSESWSETHQHTGVDGNVFTVKYDYTEKVTVRAGCIYEDLFQVDQHFGVRLSDVPEAAYELIPFSWLVDYVLNIGDYIGALRAQLTTRVVNHFTVTTIEESCERQIVGMTPALPYTTVESQPVGGGSMKHTTRFRDPAAFTADFAYLPLEVALKPPSHLQNVLALVTKQLTGMQKSSRRAR